MIETGLSDAVLPREQAFTLEEVCDPAFLPHRPTIGIAGKPPERFSPLTLPEADEG